MSAELPRLLIIGPLPPPFMGPAVATERLIASPTLRQYFSVAFLDTSDPGGFKDIGKLSVGNIRQAFLHCLGFVKLLYIHRPQVVYIPISRGFWGFLRDLGFIIPSRLSGASVVSHLRAGRFDLRHDDGLLGRMLARLGLNLSTYGVVLGETLRGVFGDLLPQHRVRVVPNGIDLETWKLEPPASVDSKRSRFEVLYLSNLYRDKGAHVLLKAMPQVRAHIPDVHVTFAGEWNDPSYETECMEIVRAHHLEDCVEFIGRVGEQGKKELLKLCDLTVFVPVKPEGSPWVVLEAMASAKPIIGTAQGVMEEVIVNGLTGFIIPTEDAAALAAHIIQLASDPEKSATMGRNGRRRIEEVYSETVTHRCLAEIMLEAIRCEATDMVHSEQ